MSYCMGTFRAVSVYLCLFLSKWDIKGYKDVEIAVVLQKKTMLYRNNYKIQKFSN